MKVNICVIGFVKRIYYFVNGMMCVGVSFSSGRLKLAMQNHGCTF